MLHTVTLVHNALRVCAESRMDCDNICIATQAAHGNCPEGYMHWQAEPNTIQCCHAMHRCSFLVCQTVSARLHALMQEVPAPLSKHLRVTLLHAKTCSIPCREPQAIWIPSCNSFPPLPAIVPMTRGAAMTPGYFCTLKSTLAAIRLALRMLRQACTCVRLVWDGAKYQLLLQPAQVCSIKGRSRAYFSQHSDRQQAVKSCHQVLWAVVHQPPASCPDQAKVIAVKEGNGCLDRVLQQQ